ncbi:hypothetical protein [Listeria booriae]|uniref:hypothetical protein n=1 Tax=Listeria booriae TaxID=1552123 RepID=UPI00162660D5|nr:hypothetical protein [Listeria booriae]MBC2048250.1 hypothetical protein [Listeria booriae]
MIESKLIPLQAPHGEGAFLTTAEHLEILGFRVDDEDYLEEMRYLHECNLLVDVVNGDIWSGVTGKFVCLTYKIQKEETR